MPRDYTNRIPYIKPINVVLEGRVRFGMLTVTGDAEPYICPNGRTLRKFACICDCGHNTEVLLANLRSGSTKSCGCMRWSGLDAYNKRRADTPKPPKLPRPFKPRPKRPLEDRFWEKVKKQEGCWPWTGARSGGYGAIVVTSTGQKKRMVRATRVMWFITHGQWPTKCVLHSCDNPICVNPDHLSDDSHAENSRQQVARGRHHLAVRTHCLHGHEFSEENTYRDRRGGRHCRQCSRDIANKRYWRLRGFTSGLSPYAEPNT